MSNSIESAIDSEVLQALENYAEQTNILLDFIDTRCPSLTKVQTIQLSSLILKKLIDILSKREI